MFVSAEDLEKEGQKYVDLWTPCRKADGIQKCRYVKVNSINNVTMYTTANATRLCKGKFTQF